MPGDHMCPRPQEGPWAPFGAFCYVITDLPPSLPLPRTDPVTPHLQIKTAATAPAAARRTRMHETDRAETSRNPKIESSAPQISIVTQKSALNRMFA